MKHKSSKKLEKEETGHGYGHSELGKLEGHAMKKHHYGC